MVAFLSLVILGTMTHILWAPEAGTCTQCGISHAFIRRCTCENLQTKLCKICWSEFFLDECKIAPGPWKDDVAHDWCFDIELRLVFEGEDGTSQDSRLLN